MTIKYFIRKFGVGFTCKRIDKRPDNTMDGPIMTRHFRCTIRHLGTRMVVYFSQGSGPDKDPTCEDILDCLKSDVSGLPCSFENWASDLGYDTDSRSAEKVYKAINRQRVKLLSVFGEDILTQLINCEGL